MRTPRIIVITDDMIVCICNRLTESDVRKTARQGAVTPEAAYACFGSEVECGCCLDYAQEVIDDERASRLHLHIVPAKAA